MERTEWLRVPEAAKELQIPRNQPLRVDSAWRVARRADRRAEDQGEQGRSSEVPAGITASSSKLNGLPRQQPEKESTAAHLSDNRR